MQIRDLSSGLRFKNYAIDYFVFYIIGILIKPISILYSEPWIVFSIFLISYPSYYIICEYFLQRTLGKYFTKSVVINEFGEKPDFRTIVIRTLIRLIPFEPFSFIDQNRGWHDRWTHTYVIKKSELINLKELLNDPENFKS